MIELRETDTFAAWLRQVRDNQARAKIAVRVRRLAFGNPGDVKPVGDGISELRVHHGGRVSCLFRAARSGANPAALRWR